MRPDNTEPLILAARRRRELARAKAVRAVRELDRAGTPVTFQAVARTAGVSRSWLYAQDDLRGQIERFRTRQQQAPAAPQIPDRQRATPASLLRRLEAATTRIRALEADNRQLRDALEHALGEKRAEAILTPAATRPENTPQKRPTPTFTPRPEAREQQCPRHKPAGQKGQQPAS